MAKFNRKGLLDLEGRIKWDDMGGKPSLSNGSPRFPGKWKMRACNIISLTEMINSNYFDSSSVHIHQTNEDPARRGKGTGLNFVKIYIEGIKFHIFTLYVCHLSLLSVLMNPPGVE